MTPETITKVKRHLELFYYIIKGNLTTIYECSQNDKAI